MAIFGVLDAPAEDTVLASEGFLVEGFAFDTESGPFERVVVRHGGVEIGSTLVRHRRADVPSAVPEITDPNCGFRIFAQPLQTQPSSATVEVCAIFPNDAAWVLERHVTFGPADYRESPYGALLHAESPVVFRRNDIYSVGPPSADASIECVALLDSYLSRGQRVLDVGCGIGAYGPPLLAAGIDWRGCEVNAQFVDQLRERGLPVTLVDGGALPFDDDSFEVAMCIEVLEHIEAYDPFVADIARVAKQRALFSVPNAEAIPVLADRLVVPWHLLEADHKNFFTRGGLRAALSPHFERVEILPYGRMPLTSSNGSPVYYHLFAVAEHAA